MIKCWYERLTISMFVYTLSHLLLARLLNASTKAIFSFFVVIG